MNRIITIFFAFAILFGVSCNKKKDNYSCHIIHPYNGQEFATNEDIIVDITTSDADRNILLLYIDNKCYGATSEAPYQIIVKGHDLTVGKHTLKVVAQNSEGKESEASVVISAKEAIIESPDFVDFSDGELPAGWKTNGWYITPVSGYLDSFSLFTRSQKSTVTTLKTCSSIEFYLLGNGIINFYMDDVLVEEIQIGYWTPVGLWEKYEYGFSEGLHTFAWIYLPSGSAFSARLDAISFE
jgi:hypothetical protein